MQNKENHGSTDTIRLDLRLPVIGRIAAGSPIEPIDKHEILDLASILCEEGCYILVVKGNSMIGEGILDGDRIICKRECVAKDGDIAVVLIDQEKATLKRVRYKPNDIIELEAANPEFQPQSYPAARLTIQGILIGLLRLPLNHVTEKA